MNYKKTKLKSLENTNFFLQYPKIPDSEIREIIRSFRLKEQTPVIVTFLFGVLDSNINLNFYFCDLVATLSAIVLISILSFMVNEFTDVDTDQIRDDRKKSTLSKKQFWRLFFVFSLNIFFFAIFSSQKTLIVLIYLVGLSYSFPKIRFKAIFPFDTITLGISCVVLPYIAPFYIGGKTVNMVALTYLLFFLCSTNLVAVSRDIKPDRKAGLKNLGVILGHKGMMWFGVITISISIIISFYLNSQFQFFWYQITKMFELPLFRLFLKGLKSNENNYVERLTIDTKRGVFVSWGLIFALSVSIFIFN